MCASQHIRVVDCRLADCQKGKSARCHVTLITVLALLVAVQFVAWQQCYCMYDACHCALAKEKFIFAFFFRCCFLCFWRSSWKDNTFLASIHVTVLRKHVCVYMWVYMCVCCFLLLDQAIAATRHDRGCKGLTNI